MWSNGVQANALNQVSALSLSYINKIYVPIRQLIIGPRLSNIEPITTEQRKNKSKENKGTNQNSPLKMKGWMRLKNNNNNTLCAGTRNKTNNYYNWTREFIYKRENKKNKIKEALWSGWIFPSVMSLRDQTPKTKITEIIAGRGGFFPFGPSYIWTANKTEKTKINNIPTFSYIEKTNHRLGS